jgi:hypothetical protein
VVEELTGRAVRLRVYSFWSRAYKCPHGSSKKGTNMKNPLLAFVVAAAMTLSSVAIAAPNCGAWNWQSEGVYEQVCVNDDGSRHCYRATDENGSNAYEISC